MSGFDFGYIFDYDTDAKVMELSEKINSLDFSQSLTDLRDVLEVYKLHQWPRDYVESDDSFEVSNVKKLIGDLNIDIKAFIGKSLGANIADYWMIQYLAMSDLNGGCFDKLFTEYNLWVKLSDKCFAQFVDSNRFLIKDFMIKRNKPAVEKFSEIINASLVNNDKRLLANLGLIIRHHESMYFPDVFLSNNYFQKMVSKYLDVYPRHYIDTSLIYSLINFDSKTLLMDEHTRYRLDEERREDRAFNSNPVSNRSIFVSLAELSDENLSIINDMGDDPTRFDVFINTLWLDLIPDENLLLAIIYKYIVDSDGCPYVEYCTDSTWIDNIYSNINGGIYNNHQTLMGHQNELVTILTISALNTYLCCRFDDTDLSLEDLIVKYINSISDKYGINTFYMKDINPRLDISDKNLILSINIESILKQFDLLYRYKYVNVGYMAYFDVKGFLISEIPSFIPSKYLDVGESLKPYFLRHSYYNGYPCYVSGESKSELDRLDLHYTPISKLFADRDAFFLNHVLNNRNGFSSLAIRNKYAHDSTIGLSDDDHQINYYYIILAFMIVIAKLDKEFKWIKQNGISK